MFMPHVTAVALGTTVEFLNSDSVAHNVFWPSISGNKKLGHNLGTCHKGKGNPSSSTTRHRVAALQCPPGDGGLRDRSPTPYFAVTDSSGNFKIDNVPDGAYTVTAWHEGAKNKSNP